MTLIERIQKFNQPYPPSLLQKKYERMAENSFSFFRATCHLFYEDLAAENSVTVSPLTWICGDLHLENFGSYKGNNRLVYFDLNDFNEAVLGPAVWELARMVASIFVAFDSLEIRDKQAREAAALFLEAYSSTLQKGKALYIEPRIAKGEVNKLLEEVRKRTQPDFLSDRTEKKSGRLELLIDKERHFKLPKEEKKELLKHLENYIDGYNCVDVAFRIAGTGSIGVNRYVFLLQHADKQKDYMLMDMKQAMSSALSPYIKNTQQPQWRHQAERMYTAQQLMQSNCPALLGFTEFQGSSFVIQELQPSSDKIEFHLIRKQKKDIDRVIIDMAALTASAQLRSSGRMGSAIADELIAFGTNKAWQQTVVDYAAAYSKTMKEYFRIFKKEYKNGIFDT